MSEKLIKNANGQWEILEKAKIIDMKSRKVLADLPVDPDKYDHQRAVTGFRCSTWCCHGWYCS